MEKEKSLKYFWIGVCNILTFFTFHISFFLFFISLIPVPFGYDKLLEYNVMYFIPAIVIFFIFVIPLRCIVCMFYNIYDGGELFIYE